MAFNNAQKFTALGMAFPLAKEVGAAIDNATDDNPAIAALVALTDSTGGTPGNTIADVPGTYTEATLANQLASLTAKVNAIIAALQA